MHEQDFQMSLIFAYKVLILLKRHFVTFTLGAYTIKLFTAVIVALS
jgi:hypothetical protein